MADNETRLLKQLALAEMAATIALRTVLNQGISSGNLVDTKIILYSYRDSSGRVCRPKALYANSQVLKTVPYFNDRESTSTLDIGRTGSHCVIYEVLFGNFAESKSKIFDEEAIDEEEYAEDYGYSSDSDLEDDDDEIESWIHDIIMWMVLPFTLFLSLFKDRSNLCGEREKHVKRGKVVKLPDMAFVT